MCAKNWRNKCSFDKVIAKINGAVFVTHGGALYNAKLLLSLCVKRTNFSLAQLTCLLLKIRSLLHMLISDAFNAIYVCLSQVCGVCHFTVGCV